MAQEVSLRTALLRGPASMAPSWDRAACSRRKRRPASRSCQRLAARPRLSLRGPRAFLLHTRLRISAGFAGRCPVGPLGSGFWPPLAPLSGGVGAVPTPGLAHAPSLLMSGAVSRPSVLGLPRTRRRCARQRLWCRSAGFWGEEWWVVAAYLDALLPQPFLAQRFLAGVPVFWPRRAPLASRARPQPTAGRAELAHPFLQA